MSRGKFVMSAEQAREMFDYSPETGVIRRKNGRVAGGKTGWGYIKVRAGSHGRFFAHRLAWLIMTGSLPAAEIDHINGIRDDNRWSNLREATTSENRQNLPMVRRNGVLLGVSWCSKRSKWRACIKVDRRFKSLGYYASQEDAHAAYCEARKEFYKFQPELRRGRVTAPFQGIVRAQQKLCEAVNN